MVKWFFSYIYGQKLRLKFLFLRRPSMDLAAYLVPGVDLVTCVNNAWLLLTVVWVLGAGWRFSPMLTVRTWFTGPWEDGGWTSTDQCHGPDSLHNTKNIHLDRANVGASHWYVFTNRSAQILLLLIFLLTGCAFKVKGVSAASLSSSDSLHQLWSMMMSWASETPYYRARYHTVVFNPNPLFHTYCKILILKHKLWWDVVVESAEKASLTEAPLKMTGGDCHDTLMPLSLPNPASSGHTGILTGAVAWNMDGGTPHNGGEEEEESIVEDKRVL